MKPGTGVRTEAGSSSLFSFPGTDSELMEKDWIPEMGTAVPRVEACGEVQQPPWGKHSDPSGVFL